MHVKLVDDKLVSRLPLTKNPTKFSFFDSVVPNPRKTSVRIKRGHCTYIFSFIFFAMMYKLYTNKFRFMLFSF